MVAMVWGLIPYWAKDPAIGNRMINARAESVANKPAYKEAFRRRRCLVPADGFYEWKVQPGGKQPYFIHLEGRHPFAFAGLWERWRPRGDQLEIAGPDRPEGPLTAGGRVESCAFLTTEPNELTEQIHDRMPLILPERHWETWLDPAINDPSALAELLVPYPADDMRAYPVSTHVNKPEHDDRACIEPLETIRILRPESPDDAPRRDPDQPSLF
jgi:putative SOS response-associated peptidase YedK